MEDNLFILRYCIEGSYKRGKPLFVMAIDFVKAFDSVNMVALQPLMWHRCDPYLIQVVTELCMGDCTEIIKGQLRIGQSHRQITQMKVSDGIRQGCTGSPQLFVMIGSEYDYKRNTREHSGRFGKSSHISIIINSVTHLWSSTN